MTRTDHSKNSWPDVSANDLRALAAKHQKVLEQQRTQLARKLHDDLIQKLTVLSLELALLESGTLPGPADAPLLKPKIQELTHLVTEMIQSVRKIKMELRPKLLDECGLTAAVESEAAAFAKRTGCKTRVRTTPEDFQVPDQIGTEMFRMLQEIICNIEKHAQAQRVEIDLKQERGGFLLRVSDNGIGLAPDRRHGPNALGLLELRERTAALGGELDIQAAPGQGTTIIVRVPLAASGSMASGSPS